MKPQLANSSPGPLALVLFPKRRNALFFLALTMSGLSSACAVPAQSSAEQDSSPQDAPETGSTSGDEDSQEPGTESGGSQEESTSSETDSDSSSTSDEGPAPDSPLIVIQDNVTLCGAIRWTLDSFDEAFSSKNQLILKGGTYPADAFELHGKLRYEDMEVSVDTERVSVFIDSGGESHAWAALDDAPTKIGENDTAKVTFRLTAVQDGTFKTFKLDDFSRFESDQEYKSIRIVSETDLDIFDGYKGSAFGPCETPDVKTEVFRFEFEQGDWVEFETKTRLPMFDIPSQHGLTVRAHGKVEGVEFDVSEWKDLIYATTKFSEFPRPPSLGVRFPKQKGICGVGFEAYYRDENIPYKAQILDCDLKVKSTPKLSAAKYPDYFEIP